MPHPLVDQLRFTHSEWRRALDGISEPDAARRVGPMNCISWNVGHLAWQEQRYFVWRAQDRMPVPELNELFAYGAPGSAPSLAAMWVAWETVVVAADPWLDTLTADMLGASHEHVGNGSAVTLTFGNLLQRTIYHYRFHTGENLAIRQLLGHRNLPEFVGNIDGEAPFRPH